MQDLNITLVQSDLVWENKAENLSRFALKIRNINSKSDLIILPEMFNTAFSMKPELLAEEPFGETHQWMKNLSQEVNIAIVGSFMVSEHGNFYNRLIVMHPNGEYQQYDKRHLFRMAGEHEHYTPGSESLIFEFKGWKIKTLICYDLRFPVYAKNNYNHGKYDYDALIFVANWPTVRNHIWVKLLVARALENQAYVIGVNRVGNDINGFSHSGSSCIINPEGDYIIAPIDHIETEETASISLTALQEFRKRFTLGLDWDHFELVD